MATYYARNVTGNWATTSSWDSAASTGAGPAGPPIAGDTAIFDANFTGHIDIAAAAACTTLTCSSGAAGTLDFNAGFTLTLSGVPTFVSTMTLAGTGTLRMNTAGNINSAGLSIPALYLAGNGTYTLDGALTVTGALTQAGNVAFSGNYDITCGTLTGVVSSALTLQIVSGYTLNVTTAIAVGTTVAQLTIRATSASNHCHLVYTGADATTVKVCNVQFTDIDYSGTHVTSLDNWYGATTRCNGITNRTTADFATDADKAYLLSTRTIGGVTGTYHEATTSEVLDNVSFGASSALTGLYHAPAASEVISTAVFGVSSGTSGTFDESARNTDPGEANVKSGTSYKIQNVAKNGSYSAVADYPSEDDVRDGVDYDSAAKTGNMTLPATTDVKDGVTYGTDGTELEGSYVGGGGGGRPEIRGGNL